MSTILETAVIQEWMVRTLSQQYLPYRLKDLLVLHCHTSGIVIIGVVCGNYFTGETTRIMWGRETRIWLWWVTLLFRTFWSVTLFFLPTPITYQFLLLLLARKFI